MLPLCSHRVGANCLANIFVCMPGAVLVWGTAPSRSTRTPSVSTSRLKSIVCSCGTSQETPIRRFASTLRSCGEVFAGSARTPSVSRSGLESIVCSCGTNQGSRIRRFAPTFRVCGTACGRSARTPSISRSGLNLTVFTCGTSQGTQIRRFPPTEWEQIV